MGQQQSKDELLYQQVSYGNFDAIRALYADGAKLEYVDGEGKTPLIAACLNPALYNVAKTLIELGANVNAYRPGRNGGTPLHHAAKRGLDETVKLLLSHGANALLVNDDCQTPLDIARIKGFTNVVRTIEAHICLYSGWLKESYGPGFLGAFAPQLFSKNVWVVVAPCGSRNLRQPFKLELAIYTSIKEALPCTHIALWKSGMEEPDFNRPDPAVIISEESTKTRIKLVPVNGSDKHLLQQFCNACKGIPQVAHSNLPLNNASSIVPSLPATAPPTNPPAPAAEEDLELSMAINASIQSAIPQGLPVDHLQTSSGASSSTSIEPPTKEKVGSTDTSAITSHVTQTPVPTPSAPTITDEADVLPDGPIHYPTIDFTAMDTSYTSSVTLSTGNNTEEGSNKVESSSCIICFDAPVEAACVPCGHMAGCISCLNEIKAKSMGCPVCRTMIDQVIKVYSV